MELHSEPLQRVFVENESTFSNFDIYGYELAIYGLRCIAVNTCARFTSVGRAFTGRDRPIASLMRVTVAQPLVSIACGRIRMC